MVGRLELVLLTAAFPYGNVAEPFLETEIEVLADRFDQVYVLPSSCKDDTRRPLPANVELVEMDWLAEPRREEKLGALLSTHTAKVVGRTLLSGHDARGYLRGWRYYTDILARNLLKTSALARFVEERRLESALFYDYWFENSTLALALLRRSGRIGMAISRAHRFDIYDECWGQGPVPFREVKAEGLDAVFAVSVPGRDYLQRRLPTAHAKIRLARLGVRDPGRPCPPATTEVPVIVTCARLEARKRIDLVPEVLSRLNRPVHWIHLGDGPERERVMSAASKLPGEIRWELRGQLDNREVLRFYERQHVDAFLSLSTSEGLPVSMMEAQSYGIPIVACAVDGVPEIVTDTTGIRLPADTTPATAAAGMQACLVSGRFNPRAVRGFFNQHFDATVNYNRFVDALIELRPNHAAGTRSPSQLPAGSAASSR